MLEAVGSQIRVISALAIREIQNQNNKLEVGLAWAFVEVLLYVAVISLVRVVLRAFMPPNMPPLTFLITGILPWQTFLHTMKSVQSAATKNKNLLSLPIITPLDLVLASAVKELCVYSIVFFALALTSSYYEGVGFPRFPLGIILLYLAAWLMGIGYGLICVPALRMFPPAKWLLTPLLRVGFWTSGLYFVMATLPTTTWPYMTWNPMLHVNELMRTYWFTTYNTPVGSPAYIIECLCGMLLLGLMLERYIRRVPA
jgi:capsular polysaccharide transport system permease protein